MTWTRHLKLLAATFVGVNLALYLFVLAMNPYGNLPNTALRQHRMMDDNQRYQYPSVVRSGRYDSILIGTSTSRLIDPRPLEAMLGGRFANVAMNAATAWEQTELAKLFLRHQPQPHVLVVGIDVVWCAPNADRERITFRGFPQWMYDANRWNDLAYMYNVRALEIAGRRLAAAIAARKPRLPDDGFEIFTPPETHYDLAKAQAKIYVDNPSPVPAPKSPPDSATAAERATWTFPALAWLDDLIARGNWQRVVLLFPPVHAIAQPRPGTMEALREDECKARIARIGSARKVPVVDFRIRSSITTKDEHFWDHLHYRVPIAERVQQGLAQALATGRDDPGGDWRVLKAGE